MKRIVFTYGLMMFALATMAATAGSPLCFTAVKAGAEVGIAILGSSEHSPLVYSTDGVTWQDYVSGKIKMNAVGDKAYFRAKKESAKKAFNTHYSNCRYFTLTDSASVSGDVTTLLEPEGNVLDLAPYEDFVFVRLFLNCDKLTEAKDLLLPSTRLNKYCYSSMFRGCTGLKTMPLLGALNVPEGGYEQMFYDCTSLVSTGLIRMETATTKSCSEMFRNCASLTEVKTTLTSWEPADDATHLWLYGMLSGGTFYHLYCLSDAARGPSTFPYAWSSATFPTTNVNFVETEHGFVKMDRKYALEGELITLIPVAEDGWKLDTIWAKNSYGEEVKLSDEYQFTIGDRSMNIFSRFVEDPQPTPPDPPFPPTDLEDVKGVRKVLKVMDGNGFRLIRDGKAFTIIGQQIK